MIVLGAHRPRPSPSTQYMTDIVVAEIMEGEHSYWLDELVQQVRGYAMQESIREMALVNLTQICADDRITPELLAPYWRLIQPTLMYGIRYCEYNVKVCAVAVYGLCSALPKTPTLFDDYADTSMMMTALYRCGKNTDIKLKTTALQCITHALVWHFEKLRLHINQLVLEQAMTAYQSPDMELAFSGLMFFQVIGMVLCKRNGSSPEYIVEWVESAPPMDEFTSKLLSIIHG